MMRGGLLLGGTLAILAIAVAAPAAPYPTPTDPALEARIQAELAARDPDGAAVFARANEARERGDATTARNLLQQVHDRDPWFVHATRRLCTTESRLGHHDTALALCREAYSQDPSAFQSTALSMALLAADTGKGSYGTQALDLAREATRKAPDDYFAQLALCQAALRMNDTHAVTAAAAAMRRIAPRDPAALFFSALDEASHGNLDTASRDLEEAHANGLPDDMYGKLHEGIEGARSPVDRYGPTLLKALLGWLAGFGVLLVLGGILSAATLRVAGRVPAEATGQAKGADAMLRRVYRAVLAITCAYYYLSLPFVALSVVALGGGVIYFFLSVGQIPIKLLVLAAIVVLGSLTAMIRSLLVRSKDEAPGERLVLGDHPRLRALLGEVASRVGTRAVDAVYVTPGTDISVFERGDVVAQLRGKSERCLVLGAGVLEGMRVRELKAILAHEYGHFQNADTAGGGLALAVRRSLFTFAVHLARGGNIALLSPAWWFVRAFDRVFHRVSRGATRLQEILADRWAAFAYGSEAFSSGLRHVVAQSVRFDAHINATLGEVVPAKKALVNVYSFVPGKPADPQKVEEAINEAMSKAPSPYDSHPPPVDRIAWVRKLGAVGPPETEEDLRDAWSLLESREDVEKRMTDEVRARLALRGVRVIGVPAGAVPSRSLTGGGR
jgi:Zn-dependent protease with chaperone function